jgi:hypothetical protein
MALWRAFAPLVGGFGVGFDVAAPKFLLSAENKNFNRLRSLAFSGDQADVSTREGQKAATGRLWPVARLGRPGEPAKGDAGVALDLLAVVRAGNWFKAC